MTDIIDFNNNDDLTLIFLFSNNDNDKKVKEEIVKTLSGVSSSTRNALINARSGNNNLTPLMLSVTKGFIETTIYLIDKGANKDNCDGDGNTALHIACQNGDENLVLLLLDKNCNPNLKNNTGDTPLLLAAFSQHKHIIEIFKKKKLKINDLKDNELKEYSCHRKPLNNIIFDDKIELEKNLQYNIENNNMDINLKLPIGDGLTLLMLSAILDHVDCLELLIRYKAEVDTVDNYGRSALLRSCGRGNIKSVCLLVKEKANVNLSSGIIDSDNGFLTPLMASVIGKSKNALQVASVLLENNADVKCVNNHKETVLHMAVKCGSEQCIKLIVPHCIDNGIINAADDNGDTCLHIAARCNCNRKIIEHLLVVKDRDIAEDRTDKEKTNLQGETALMIATRMGHIDVVYAFLDNGVRLYTKGEKNIKGLTPLHAASREGNWEIVHLLCDRIKVAKSNSSASTVSNLQNYDDDETSTYINSKLPDSDDNALLLSVKGAATRRGNSDYLNCIMILVDAGIDVDAKNKKNETALTISVSEGLVDIVKVLLNRKFSNSSRSNVLDQVTAKGNLITDTFSSIADSVEFKDIVTTLNCAVKIEGRQSIIELAIEFASKKIPDDKSYRDEPIKLAVLSRRLEYLWREDGSNLLFYDEWVEGLVHVSFYKAVLRNDLQTIDKLTKGKTNDLSNLSSRSLSIDGYQSIHSSSPSSPNKLDKHLNKKLSTEVSKSFCCRNNDVVDVVLNNTSLIESNLKYLQEIELSDISHNISDIKNRVSNIDITKNISDIRDAMGLGLAKRWYEARDRTGSTVLLWTASLGLTELAKILIERCEGIDINVQHTETQSTPLILAARFNHLSFVKLMIEKNAFKEAVNVSNRTALAVASRKNMIDCVKYLIKVAPSMLEMRDMLGRTPLLNSIKPYSKENSISNVSFEVVEILLQSKADVTVRDYEGRTALTMLIDYRHESVDSDSDVRKVMEIIKLLLLHEAKDSDGKVPSDVITTEILFINSSVLSSSRDPLSIIHKLYKKNENDSIPIVTELERIIHDRRILERIFTFQYSLITAARTHIFDSAALRAKAAEMDLILEEMFMSESLEHDHNVIQLLLPALSLTEYNNDIKLLDCPLLSKEDKNKYLKKYGRKYKSYFKRIKSNTKTFEVDKMQIRRKLGRFLQLNYAHSIKCRGGVLYTCIKRDLKIIFNFPKVSNILQNVLYETLSPREPKDSGYISFNLNNFELDFRSEVERLNMFRNIRYCPIMMCMLDLTSKLLTLLVIAYLCTTTTDDELSYIKDASIILKIMTLGQVLTEYGQLHEQRFSFFDHFDDWNSIDAMSDILLVTWAILDLNQINLGVESRAILSVAAIPQSLSLLQYASLSKPTGELVIMIKGMSLDVFPFLIIYLVSTVGLAITFNGLYSAGNDSSYSSIGNAFLSLYSATLGGFNFDVEGSEYSSINSLGVAFLTVYVLGSSVLLLNLLVACMSATYQRIADKSMQEWSFFIAKTVQQFIIIEERSPFNVLPAPLNIITSALAPIHYLLLWTTNISLAGTVADFILYILGVVLCYPYIYYVTLRKMPYIYMKIFTNLQVTAKVYWLSQRRETRYKFFKELLMSLYFVFIFPITFPIYLVFMNLIFINDSNLVKTDKKGIIRGLESVSSTSTLDAEEDVTDSQDTTDNTITNVFTYSDTTRILEVMRRKETIDGKLDFLIEEISNIKRQFDPVDGSFSDRASVLDAGPDNNNVAVSSTLDYINPFNVISLFRPFTSTQRDLMLSGINDDVKALKADLKQIMKKLNHH